MASVPHPLKSLRTTRRLALALALACGLAGIIVSAQGPGPSTARVATRARVPIAPAKVGTPVTKFAVVDADGGIARHNGGAPDPIAIPEGNGVWKVVFSGAVYGCIYVAVPGDAGTTNLGKPAGAAVTVSPDPVPGELWVWTEVDTPFHLTVYCDPASTVVAAHADGRKWGGNKLATTRRLHDGDYAVSFVRTVRNCAFVAGFSVPGSDMRELGASTITVAAGAGPGTVRVHTMDTAGVPRDSAFHLAVTCDPSAPTAVVAGDGTLVRGTNVFHTERLSAGRYWVRFNRTVSGCSYIATVGEPGVGAITDPVTITTATYSGTHDAVSVEIMNRSGAYMDEPFHLVLSC